MVLALFCWLGLVAPVQQAVALDPARPIEQLRHTSWTISEGAPGNIRTIAQSPDGFLWLGTSTGLYRFDGITFERIGPQGEVRQRSLQVTALLAARNGDIWVGYDFGGIGVFRDGRLRDANPPWKIRGTVDAILQDRAGTIWVSAEVNNTTQIGRLLNGKWTEFGLAQGLRERGSGGILAATDGSLYLVEQPALLRLAKGASRFEEVATGFSSYTLLAQAPSGAIWIADNRGLRQMGDAAPFIPLPLSTTPFISRGMRFDHDGNLWLSAQDDGLARFPKGAGKAFEPVEFYNDKQGLSARTTLTTFEDREGNLWVGTRSGLDRFSASSIAQSSWTEALATGFAGGGAARGIFVSTLSGVYRLNDPPAKPDLVFAKPGIGVLCGDDHSLLAISLAGEFLIRSGIATDVTATGFLDRPPPITCAKDSTNALWATFRGLYQLSGERMTPANGAPGGEPGAASLLRSDGRGGLLAYRPTEGLKSIRGGKISTLMTSPEIAIGWVRTLLRTPAAILLGGEWGLGRFDGHRRTFLMAGTYPFLAGVTGIAQTANGSTWIIGAEGIVRMATAELDTAFQYPGAPIAVERFGFEGGFRSRSDVYDSNDIAEDATGRLWFATNRGLAWIDPARLARNTLPPPVVIRGVSAGGVTYPAGGKAITLPAGTTRVQIDFTALSLTDAPANHFRYRLAGADTGWIDAQKQRQASYTNLGPGRYSFRVVAANNDGVWNYQGATLAFTVAPAFYQTMWFYALLVLAALVLVWLVYRWRLRTIAERTRSRIEAQMLERERIARELHDTFLQSVQGLMLRFQAIAERIAKGTSAREQMDAALDHGDDVILEGRDSVRGLRASDIADDLVAPLEALPDLAGIPLELSFKGTQRSVCAPVTTEILAIVTEALTNIRQHAGASRARIEILYGHAALKVAVEDDGVGIAHDIRTAGARSGHFGLVGMRERADRLGGTFTIDAPDGGGTAIRITIPAIVAYTPQQRRSFWRFLTWQTFSGQSAQSE